MERKREAAQVVRMALVLLLVHSWAMPAVATDYFVAPTGHDGNAGSAISPWRTLQHAANLVMPGDRVVARPGEYVGFNLVRSGIESAPIEFVAEPGAAITAPNSFTDRDGINLEGASHVIIDGFTVRAMERAGVRTVGAPDDFAEFVTVRNVQAQDNGYWGIFTGFVDDLLIENNFASGSLVEHGIYVSNSGDRPVVRNNTIWANARNGIHFNGDQSQGGDGVINGALVSANRIYSNGRDGGSGINMDGVQNSRIENNLLYDNHSSGISLYQIDGAAPSTGNLVINNTIHQEADSRWAVNIRNGSVDNSVLNNVLVSDHSYRGAINASEGSVEGLVSDFNLLISRFSTDDGDSVIGLSTWQAQTGNDLHSQVVEPGSLFLDPTGGDYRLRDDAIAIDAGTSLSAPLIDIAGNQRPSGSAIDIGAYEYSAAIAWGDYNANGSIDAADFTIWRDTYGATVDPFAGADGDGSGTIDAGDYQVWSDAYRAASLSRIATPALPESTSISLLTIACSIGALRRFQFRR